MFEDFIWVVITKLYYVFWTSGKWQTSQSTTNGPKTNFSNYLWIVLKVTEHIFSLCRGDYLAFDNTTRSKILLHLLANLVTFIP